MEVDFARKRVKLHSGLSVLYDKLIVATGAQVGGCDCTECSPSLFSTRPYNPSRYYTIVFQYLHMILPPLFSSRH